MPIQKLIARGFWHAYQERSSLRSRTHTFGSKKVAQLPPFITTFVAPDPEDTTSTPLELDELWSCVLKKANHIRVWIALCRKRRQLVAYVLGDRSKQTRQRLWESIPFVYRPGYCFKDFWAAYSAVIPKEQHTAVGKKTGETVHVERWYYTLWQHFARFVRMKLSFPKSLMIHEACLLLLLHAIIESGPSCSSEPLS